MLWQTPGWILGGFLAFVAVSLAGVPLWVSALALAAFVAKDLLRPRTLAPRGHVLVHGQRWRAELRRGGTVPAGSSVRVVGVEGLTLLVEPVDASGARS